MACYQDKPAHAPKNEFAYTGLQAVRITLESRNKSLRLLAMTKIPVFKRLLLKKN